jgi:hypothetical protein
MPDSAEYLQRVQSLVAGDDYLAIQSQTADALSELIEGVPEGELQQRPKPEKWSVAEIVAHLAEDEIATAWRYRQMIETPGCPLAGFDQDLWAKLGIYRSRQTVDSLELFRLLRRTNIRMLERLTPEEWQRHGIHSERGRITVQELARHMAGHDTNHLQQVRSILGN